MQGSAAAGRGLLGLPRSQRMLELCEAFPADQGYVGPFPALACPPVGLTPGIRAVLVAPCRCFSASLALGCGDALAVPGAASPCQCLKGCSYIQMLSHLGEALRSWGSALVPREINKQIKSSAGIFLLPLCWRGVRPGWEREKRMVGGGRSTWG